MKLLELFITETTEEDRALISLSSAVYKHIQKYADYIDPDSTEPLDTGKIDDFCTTPIEGIEEISVVLLQGDALKEKVRQERIAAGEIDSETDDNGKKVILGMWDNKSPAIILNADYISSSAIKSTIVHELRHGLDDLKSGGKGTSSGKYRTPKKKEHRKTAPYIAQPAEINARFAQVLHSVTAQIERKSHLPLDQVWSSALSTLKHSMDVHKISTLFPEKEASSDYKRLMKRAADYIKKEIDYQKSEIDEDIPAPGESSGVPAKIKSNSKPVEKFMTVTEILNSVKEIPYVNEILADYRNNDDSWIVYKKVIEYANYLKKNPESISDLPPIIVVDGHLQDGAHRLSAITLLIKEMDTKNPIWAQTKLRVHFVTKNDIS